MRRRLCVITPVHNEGPHVTRVVAGMRAQRCAPDLWLIVDDQSTDCTLERVRAATSDLDYVRVITYERPQIETNDRLALALEASSFNYGLKAAGGADAFDFIAKLDGDIVLPPDYYETCLAHMEKHAEVGLVCGQLRETLGGMTRIIPIPGRHVHGALKLYRRECFRAIGGIWDRLGWDAIDEIYARMNGFTTISLPVLVGEHLRPVGSSDGLLRGRARHGHVAYITHFPVYWVVGRSLKLALARPRVLSGLAFLWGYAQAAIAGCDRVDDPAFRAFARRELRLRTLSVLQRVLRADDRPTRTVTSGDVRQAES
jgi:poly-beta-1,6-N-acetyl-D-glucosamine synthase